MFYILPCFLLCSKFYPILHSNMFTFYHFLLFFFLFYIPLQQLLLHFAMFYILHCLHYELKLACCKEVENTKSHKICYSLSRIWEIYMLPYFEFNHVLHFTILPCLTFCHILTSIIMFYRRQRNGKTTVSHNSSFLCY